MFIRRESSPRSNVGCPRGPDVRGPESIAPHARSKSAGARCLLPPSPRPSRFPCPKIAAKPRLEQTLKRLGTTASVLMIVAHPDDEDGALLTYLSRGLGVRATLFTLTRGEGGQNVMSADSDDALGLIRTNELLKADEFYGAKQLWGTEVDFGFSKTQQEAFAQWGHDRVLYDAVLAVRRTRPQIIVSTFVGGITDGHGQHQVSGEIAQEVFKAAGDPKVFPEQLEGRPRALAATGRVFQDHLSHRVTEKGMFDYATGKWAPAKFQNYITGEWITGVPSTDATIPVGTPDLTLGRSYVQIAREGWGEQKIAERRRESHTERTARWRAITCGPWRRRPQPKPGSDPTDGDLYHNRKVDIDTSIAGLARLVPGEAPEWLSERPTPDRRANQSV